VACLIMKKSIVTLCCSLALAACEGNSSSSDFAQQGNEAPAGKVQIAIIGNSITHHDPKPTIGWMHNNGMAASDASHDFAHLLLRKIGARPSESYVRNFYPFETNNAGAADNIASLEPIMASSPKVVVIELGDNVADKNLLKLYDFNNNYAALTAEVKPAKALFCLSTWWGYRSVDWVIERQCKAAGGTFVYIGDIYRDPANPDKALPHYAAKALDTHPKDYSMQRIALRLWKAGVRI
jgi:hypothetical protein